MIILDTTTKSLEVVLAGAVATTQPTYALSASDILVSSMSLSNLLSTDGATTSATPVTVLAAPVAGHVRQLKYLSVVNGDTAAVTLTVQLRSSGTARPVWVGSLLAGDTLYYVDGQGFQVVSASGVKINSVFLPHRASHETGGSDALTSLSASILTSGTVAVARLSSGVTTASTSTTTGTQNAWAPGLSGNTIITWTGSADLTVNGIVGGVSGQLLTIKNNGTAIIYVTHASGLASAADQCRNYTTSGPTPIAQTGSAVFIWDGVWRLVAHEQGAWIDVPFSAASYSGYPVAMTWTTLAAQVKPFRYRIAGRTMFVTIAVIGSTLGGTAGTLARLVIPGGYQAQPVGNQTFVGGCSISEGGVYKAGAAYTGSIDYTHLDFGRGDSAVMTLGAFNVLAQTSFEIA